VVPIVFGTKTGPHSTYTCDQVTSLHNIPHIPL